MRFTSGLVLGMCLSGQAGLAQGVDLESPWSGFWIGGSLGYGSVNYDISGGIVDAITGEDALSFNLPDAGGHGGVAGIELGYSLAFGDRWVGALRINHAVSDIANDTSLFLAEDPFLLLPPAKLDYDVVQKSRSVLSGQLGYLVSDQTMVYGVLGLARSNFEGVLRVEAVGVGAFEFTDSFRVDGFTVGTGMETMLTDKLSLKFEYQMMLLDDYDLGPIDLVLVNLDAVAETQIQTFQTTLSYRF
jgi:outer membrane immunogenic protein